MWALILLYSWPILAGTTASVTLSFLGAHLATRDRVLQTLCISQGAVAGVIIGLGGFYLLGGTGSPSLLPLLSGLLASWFTAFMTDRLALKAAASKNARFALVFSLLFGLGFLVSSVIPQLENHVTQLYFGDLATLSDQGAWIILASSLSLLFVFGRYHTGILRESFDSALYGEGSARNGQQSTANRIFLIGSLLILCLCVQYLGYLFTVGLLFIPTGALTFTRVTGVKKHFLFAGSAGFLGSLIGFILSLKWTWLPTVPTILWAVFSFLFLACLMSATKNARRYS